MFFDGTEVCEIKRREIQYINISILYGDMILTLTLSDQKFSLTNENF